MIMNVQVPTLVVGIVLGVVFKSWIMQLVGKIVKLARELVDWVED